MIGPAPFQFREHALDIRQRRRLCIQAQFSTDTAHV
jgi:hypothetical protein